MKNVHLDDVTGGGGRNRKEIFACTHNKSYGFATEIGWINKYSFVKTVPCKYPGLKHLKNNLSRDKSTSPISTSRELLIQICLCAS